MRSPPQDPWFLSRVQPTFNHTWRIMGFSKYSYKHLNWDISNYKYIYLITLNPKPTLKDPSYLVHGPSYSSTRRATKPWKLLEP